MKNVNELDDFLRQKEEEFNIPYSDKYWEKTSAFLDAERGGRVISRWSIANIALLTSVIILSIGLVGYFVFNSNSNHKAETTVSATVNSSASKTGTSISANNSNNNNNNTTISKETNANAIANEANASSKANTVKNESVAKSSNAKASKGTSGKSNSSLSVSSIPAGKSNSKSLANSLNKGVKKNNTKLANEGNNNSFNIKDNERIELNTADTRNPSYFNHPVESTIPEFENMTINDKTIAVLYGLFYKSDGSAAFKKIRELKYGAMYPQISIAVSGGLNIFQSFAESPKTYSYVSTNPFIGVKASYQWSPEWMVLAQLNVLQRGGVNQVIPLSDLKDGTINPVNETYRVRHLYYVQLPVMLGYQISKKNLVSAGFGISYLFADGAQAKDDSTGRYTGSYKFENRNGFNKIDCFATVGYTYRLNRKVSFSLTAAYGFVDVTDNGYFGSTSRDHNMNIGLGLNYNLLQKKAISR